MIELGVNIDHVATVRQARRADEPDPVWAAAEAELGGADVETVSGEREARLAFLGAAPLGRAGVVDIGGGSAELIAGLGGEIHSAASAPISSGAMLSMMLVTALVTPLPR